MRILMIVGLTLTMAALAGCGGGREAMAAEEINQGFRFSVEIDGTPSTDLWTAVEGLGMAVEAVTVRDPATGFLTSRPLGPEPVSVRLRVDFVQGSFPSVKDWVQAVYGGKDIRKDIIVKILDPSGSPVRTFNLIDCFPTSFDLIGVDTANPDVMPWTLEVRVNRIEMA